MTTGAPPRSSPAPPPGDASAGCRRLARPLRWGPRLTAVSAAVVPLLLFAVVLDRLYLFDALTSPWIAAVYLLLVGCVLPRALQHARALRAAPPPAPRYLRRLPDAGELATVLPAGTALDVVEEELRVRRYRVVRREGELSAAKGHLLGTGYLLVDLSLVALLLGLAGGRLWGYEGSVLVAEGEGFCNSFPQYDTYSAGPLVDGGDLAAVCVELERFRAEYEPDLTASSLTVDIRYGPRGKEGRAMTIGADDPLNVDGARVYLTGHGFSPTFSVVRPGGTAITDISTPFMPADRATMGSRGALKLPALGPASDDQLTLEGFFAPTGVLKAGRLTSVDPRPLDPQLAVVVYEGHLGPESGIPPGSSIDAAQIDGGRLTVAGTGNLAPGESLPLDDGTVITFTGYREVAALRYSYDPGQGWVLAATAALLLGLLGTLLVRRERVFARVGPGAGGTVLELAALTRGRGGSAPRFAALSDDVACALAARAPGKPESSPQNS